MLGNGRRKMKVGEKLPDSFPDFEGSQSHASFLILEKT